MGTSDWIALGSLAISLIALSISWSGYRRDQGRLTLHISEGKNQMSPHLVLKVVNSGRRPVMIARVFARMAKGLEAPVAETQRRIDESESVEYLVPTGSLQTVVKSLVVEDTLGRRHQARTSLVYRIRYRQQMKYFL